MRKALPPDVNLAEGLGHFLTSGSEAYTALSIFLQSGSQYCSYQIFCIVTVTVATVPWER
jgi:hypothetical protein